MIIVRLLGGMGNQMFQYALGRALAIKNADELKLDIEGYKDPSGTDPHSVRRFELHHFNIKAQIATVEEISRAKNPFGPVSAFARKIRGRFSAPSIRFDPAVLQRKGNLYLEGYWQSEQYFEQCEGAIRSDFQAIDKLGNDASNIITGIGNVREQGGIPVSLHIRRGDNAYSPESMDYFGVPPDDYYDDAVRFLSTRLNTDKLKLFVFSDDMPWVRSKLNFAFPMTFVSQPGIMDWEEIPLMASCSHHVIANSTFSWWGAWLNDRPEKIVIAPKHWARKDPWHFRDIIPANWYRL